MKIERKELLSLFLNTSVLVASLGYFVDIYDLILFGIVRVPSLTSLGVAQNKLIDVGILLLNLQMAGMLIGGIIWGILGDKKGRISVLFASIFLYSLANIGNAFVTSINAYGALRFIAGLGLAGELGAAVTLVSELLPKEQRGYGTSIIAGIGVSGAIFAAIIGENFTWQTAYIMGGVLGFLLLILRLKMFESGIYKSIAEKKISKGNFLKLFTDRKRFIKYLNCILIGTPIWFVVGVLITFSPEFGRVLKVTGPVTAGNAILFTYAGLIFGDFISGFLSQWVKSRKRILTVFISLTFILVPVYLFLRGLSPAQFYGLCVLLGFAIGYWAIFVTVAAENFGTNLRATVATTVPNFIRGSVIPITLGFEYFKNSVGIIYSALIVAVITVIIALVSLNNLEETYGKDLDYIEEL
jgi:MFS transporter, putative metabolite:H+ symporter